MRIQKEVFSSQWFNRCRQIIPDFEGYIKEKIVAVEGDIVSSIMLPNARYY